MTISRIKAIDVHAHIGRCACEGRELTDKWCSGDSAKVLRRAESANVKLTIFSHLEALMPRGKANVAKGNELAAKISAETDGLMFWVVVSPFVPASYEQAAEYLGRADCAGMKVHPEEHLYDIAEYGDELFRFASDHKAIILTHSGQENSKPEEFVQFADAYPDVRLILAHLGCTWDMVLTHQVTAIQACKGENVYVDTSSASNVTPSLLEWAVSEVGSEKILFGTDSPLYFIAMQRARIDFAEIGDDDKRNILHRNAERLFELG